MGTSQWIADNHESIKAYRREWYAKNREAEKARLLKSTKKRKQDARDKLQELKRTLKCNRCPENHPACLEFHHTDPNEKSFTISSGLSSGMSISRLLEEAAKCEVLCSNCHRKHHYALSYG